MVVACDQRSAFSAPQSDERVIGFSLNCTDALSLTLFLCCTTNFCDSIRPRLSCFRRTKAKRQAITNDAQQKMYSAA